MACIHQPDEAAYGVCVSVGKCRRNSTSRRKLDVSFHLPGSPSKVKKGLHLFVLIIFILTFLLR